MKITLQEPQFCHEIGRRDNNEDSIRPAPETATASDRLFLVCDGMGGHKDGEVASETVAEAIADYWNTHRNEPDSTNKVMNAIAAAVARMDRLVEEARGDRGMGTTLTLASVGEKSVLVSHVGDSRIYQIRPKVGIVYQSKDHSYVQTLVDRGILTLEEVRTHPRNNIITQVIQPGSLGSIDPETVVLEAIEDGDCLFLCTDGVTESLSDEALTEILCTDTCGSEKMERIKQVCSRHSRDNYSAYLIELKIEI